METLTHPIPQKKVLTVDNSTSFFATAEATAEKCLLVKKREKGAPFPRPWRASLAHSTTRNRKIQENYND